MSSGERTSAEVEAVVVRPAHSEDGPMLQRIDVATCTEDVSPGAMPEPGGDFFAGEVEPGDVLVAEVDGTVAGYVRVAPQYPLPSSSHVLEVKGLAVSPAVQRRGVGRRLVLAAARMGRSRGARRLTLHVLEPNSAARQLYGRCGFVIEGVQRQQFFLGSRYVDDIVLAMDLTTTEGLMTEATR